MRLTPSLLRQRRGALSVDAEFSGRVVLVCSLTHSLVSRQGQFFIDEHVLKATGIKSLDKYACTPGTHEDAFAPDFFV